MSWSIRMAGTPRAVAERIRRAAEANAQQSHNDVRAKEMIRKSGDIAAAFAESVAVAQESNPAYQARVVLADLSGHMDSSGYGNASVTLEVRDSADAPESEWITKANAPHEGSPAEG